MTAAGAIFACDTTLDACSVALVRGADAWSVSEPMQRGQAERLAPMASALCADAGLAWGDVSRVVVTTGPGSFTGVRVGLSFARALALALNVPCIGVPTLEALALSEGAEGVRAALIETPGAAYFALYNDEGAPLIAPRAIERGAHQALLAQAPRGPVVLNGPGQVVNAVALARYGAHLQPGLYPPHPLYLRAPHVTLPDRAS